MTLRPHPTGQYTRDEVAAILDDIRNSIPPQPVTPTWVFGVSTAMAAICLVVIVRASQYLRQRND